MHTLFKKFWTTNIITLWDTMKTFWNPAELYVNLKKTAIKEPFININKINNMKRND